MNKNISAGLLALSTLFPATAAQAEGKILTPNIQGMPFRIDCEADFNDGQPSADFLARLDSHIHGAPSDENGNTTNLYEHPERYQIVENITESLPRVRRVAARSFMHDLFAQYDAASDKAAYLKNTLQTQHQICEDFYGQVEMRCEN